MIWCASFPKALRYCVKHWYQLALAQSIQPCVGLNQEGLHRLWFSYFLSAIEV